MELQKIQLNDLQIELLKLVIDKGNKEKYYQLQMNDLYDKLNIANDKGKQASVRSRLTSAKMKNYIKYNVKTPNNDASIQLQFNEKDKQVYEQVLNDVLKRVK